MTHFKRFERSGKRSFLFAKRKDDRECRFAIGVFLGRDVRIPVIHLRAFSCWCVHVYATIDLNYI